MAAKTQLFLALCIIALFKACNTNAHMQGNLIKFAESCLTLRPSKM